MKRNFQLDALRKSVMTYLGIIVNHFKFWNKHEKALWQSLFFIKNFSRKIPKISITIALSLIHFVHAGGEQNEVLLLFIMTSQTHKCTLRETALGLYKNHVRFDTFEVEVE